jgi:hypothetical protein
MEKVAYLPVVGINTYNRNPVLLKGGKYNGPCTYIVESRRILLMPMTYGIEAK